MAETAVRGSTRIAGVNIPVNKHLWVALTYIYGIGRATAKNICDACGIDRANKVNTLSNEQLESVRNEVGNYTVEGDLRRQVMMDIKHLMDIKCYRGLRHRKGLPVRGQKTKNNARTRKGRKKQVQK